MSTTKTDHNTSRTSPLDDVAQAQILVRLREAAELAEGDLGTGLDPLRELLSDLVDRTEALDVARQMAAEPAEPPCRSLLRRSILTATEGGPRAEFLLIPFGEVRVEQACAGGDFDFTREHAESAARWFENIGRKLAIDYEHQTFDRFNTRPDGLRPAAGWIGGLEIRDDGLWAVEVDWTERAQDLLRSGEYRYFSPVIFWSDENHSNLAALGPVALTNDPAMRGVAPLAARRELDAPDADVVPREQLEAAYADIALLKNELASQQADTFVERGLRLGKIVESTRLDWRDDHLRDPEVAEQKLARAAVLLPPGACAGAQPPGRSGTVDARTARTPPPRRHLPPIGNRPGGLRGLRAGRRRRPRHRHGRQHVARPAYRVSPRHTTYDRSFLHDTFSRPGVDVLHVAGTDRRPH